MNTITLTDKEIQVLKSILRVDMDALGLPRNEQGAVRSVLKKLANLSANGQK